MKSVTCLSCACSHMLCALNFVPTACFMTWNKECKPLPLQISTKWISVIIPLASALACHARVVTCYVHMNALNFILAVFFMTWNKACTWTVSLCDHKYLQNKFWSSTDLLRLFFLLLLEHHWACSGCCERGQHVQTWTIPVLKTSVHWYRISQVVII